MHLKTVVLISLFFNCCHANNAELMRLFMKELVNIKTIQSKIQATIDDSENATYILTKMIDASSKIPTGVLMGNVFDLGNFNECYGIKYGDLYGKYCLGVLPLNAIPPDIKQNIPLEITKIAERNSKFKMKIMGSSSVNSMGNRFAICIPSNMSASELTGPIIFSDEACFSKATEPKISAGTVVTIIIIAFVFIIAIASTIVDLYSYYVIKLAPHELLIAFSFFSNGRKIFKVCKNQDQFLCLNGIKAITMMWVIIVHEYTCGLSAPISNFFYLLDWEKDVTNMFILGSGVAVDSFLVAGGLVSVYSFLKSTNGSVKFNIPSFYIHRYLRLTPALAVIVLIHIFLLNYMGNGPLWNVVDKMLVKQCETGWWNTLLYISNYVQYNNCAPQTWYLSVDMQLFILSPIILIPLWKWPKIGLSALTFLSVTGIVIPFIVAYTKKISAMLSLTADIDTFMHDYHKVTHTRFGPYVIGMAFGYYVYQIKKCNIKFHFKLIEVITLWFACLTVLITCVYAGHTFLGDEDNRWGNAIFIALSKPAWAIALCGVIFLCITGYGGPIDAFLSLPIFQFLSKISYTMYLTHYIIIVFRYASMKNSVEMSNLALMHVFWGDFVLTVVFSLLLTLTFESPVPILERHIFGKSKRQFEKKPLL